MQLHVETAICVLNTWFYLRLKLYHTKPSIVMSQLMKKNDDVYQLHSSLEDLTQLTVKVRDGCTTYLQKSTLRTLESLHTDYQKLSPSRGGSLQNLYSGLWTGPWNWTLDWTLTELGPNLLPQAFRCSNNSKAWQTLLPQILAMMGRRNQWGRGQLPPIGRPICL